MEILVVDNHSSDGSRAYLENRFPEVRFIWNQVNEGFARANNAAIRAANGDYVLILNPDTILPENIFDKCISFMKSHPDCGGLGVRMIDGSGRFLPESKRNEPGWWNSFFKMSGISQIFPNSHFFSGYYAQQTGEREVAEVEILAGAFMMIKRSVLYDLGGFDTDFFMYGEDIDLSYRLLEAGYRNYYLGNCSILHFKGESTSRFSKHHIQHFYGAMSLFVSKHYKGIKKSALHFGIYLGKTAAYFRMTLQKIIKNKPTVQGNAALNVFPHHSTETEKILAENNVPSRVMQHWPESNGNILLVEGDISFSEIIDYIDAHAGKAQVFISAEGSSSIVGSGDRNQQGSVISRLVDVSLTNPE